MRLRVAGLWVHPERRAKGVARPSQWLPRHSARYWYAVGGRYLWVEWVPFRGLHAAALQNLSGQVLETIVTFPDLRGQKMRRIGSATPDGTGAVALSKESKTLAKYPRLCEFLTEVVYDDGGPRQPGRVWVENDGLSFVVTLFELSAFLRVRLRATSLDDAFTLAEKHLNAENAPWEVDLWAKDRAQQKKKK